MSLYSSIQLANNSLKASQIGLQVIGQNIANVNTPGYIREEMVLTTAPTQRQGGLLLGMGVEVQAIVQKIDQFLEERLRGAISDRKSAEVQEHTYMQLEGLIGELSDTDLSTAMNQFFGAISEVLNQPESVSVRNLAVLQGSALTGHINRTAARVNEIRDDLNRRVANIATDVNRLAEEIAQLNLRIMAIEGGGASKSDAVGLRDQRHLALSKLSELVDIKVQEQSNGSVSIFTGGDFLVHEGRRRELEVVYHNDRGALVADVQVAEIDLRLTTEGGELAGLTLARDTILGGFLDTLNKFAATLAFEFNKVFSSGQGLRGFDELTAEFAVDDTSKPLNQAGLAFTPIHGSFQVLVYNERTGLTKTTPLLVDLDGLDQDLTYSGLVAALDAIEGISASTTATGKLRLRSDSADTQFSFAGDTSGLLAALGINTFFRGSKASDLGVNQALIDDPAKFAASQGGIGQDTQTAVALAGFLDRRLESIGGNTLALLYDRMTAQTTQGATVARSVAEGFRVFEQTLHSEHMAVSGVSLDEEAVRMISFQRAYQASARYIAMLSELLEVLVNL